MTARSPYDYRRFISSEMFILRTGPQLKPFYVHRQLLANISPELRGHVFNGMKEGVGGSMDMAHISEETMGRFLEFCYTGDYSELVEESEPPNEKNPEEPKPPLQQLLPSLELYILGDMYNIQQLKDIAYRKISIYIRCIGYNYKEPVPTVKTFIEVFQKAFENLPERTEMDPLLEFLGKYAAWTLKFYREEQGFLNIFIGNDRIDFLKLILNHVSESDNQPWPLQ